VFLGVRRLLERDAPQQERSNARARLYLQGVLVQLLNPKIAVFFLAFLPQFVEPAGGPVALQILVLGALFTVLAVLSDGAYVLLAGAVGGRLRAGRARLAMGRLSGGILIGLGVTAAVSGSSQARTAQ
jgi:threonine/homoserine/homoserine lactone efflux protein